MTSSTPDTSTTSATLMVMWAVMSIAVVVDTSLTRVKRSSATQIPAPARLTAVRTDTTRSTISSASFSRPVSMTKKCYEGFGRMLTEPGIILPVIGFLNGRTKARLRRSRRTGLGTRRTLTPLSTRTHISSAVICSSKSAELLKMLESSVNFTKLRHLGVSFLSLFFLFYSIFIRSVGYFNAALRLTL